MFLWFYKQCIDRDKLIATAKQVADRHEWPWIEPIHVQNRLFTWVVVSAYDRIGGNVRVAINKRTGKVVRWSYISR